MPISPLLEKSIEALTSLTIVNTSLAHPLDRARAQELFRALHDERVPVRHAEIAQLQPTRAGRRIPLGTLPRSARIGQGATL
jgi:hypothetical protein